MSAKKVWVTWLPQDNNQPELHATIQDLQAVGLNVNGAPWIDDLEKAVWTELADMLCGDEKPDVWLVAGRVADFSDNRIRYALSMISTNLIERAPDVRVMTQVIDGQATPELPMLAAHWQEIARQPAWGAKVVAAAFGAPAKAPELGFYCSVISNAHIGQWFTVGPTAAEDDWKGAMFGVSGGDAELAFQAVGGRGQLPETSTNEYPSMGIEAEIGEDAYTACALQNSIGEADAYYIKVKGYPDKIMFGGHPGTDQAEVNLISLV